MVSAPSASPIWRTPRSARKVEPPLYLSKPVDRQSPRTRVTTSPASISQPALKPGPARQWACSLTSKGTDRHWITRAKSTTSFRSIRRLGKGDELVEFEVRREARLKDPSLPTHFDARAVRYQRKGYAPQLLLTSLLDEKRYPADAIRTLYHERWEIELGFGEIKTDMLERLETIRSKTPAAVAQEMWGLLLAYNLVRLEIERVAAELEVPPIRISFLAALREVVEQWHFAAIVSPGTVPGRLSTTTDRLRQFLLPPRRPDRVFPRAVKIKMSNYARKLPTKSSSRSRAK